MSEYAYDAEAPVTSVAHLYTSEIRRALKHHAVWLPASSVELGTIGEIQDGLFVPLDTITRALKIAVQAEPVAGQATDSLTYQSTGGVTFQTKASGATSAMFKFIGQAEAGMVVNFSREGACLVSLRGYRTQRIANQLALRRELISRVDDSWKPSYAIVTEVVLAKSGTILVSEDSSASIEIAATADLTQPVLDIGDAALGLSVAHTSGKLFSVVGASNLTPLFRGIRMTRTWWNRMFEIGALGDEPNVAALSDAQLASAFEDSVLEAEATSE